VQAKDLKTVNNPKTPVMAEAQSAAEKEWICFNTHKLHVFAYGIIDQYYIDTLDSVSLAKQKDNLKQELFAKGDPIDFISKGDEENEFAKFALNTTKMAAMNEIYKGISFLMDEVTFQINLALEQKNKNKLNKKSVKMLRDAKADIAIAKQLIGIFSACANSSFNNLFTRLNEFAKQLNVIFDETLEKEMQAILRKPSQTSKDNAEALLGKIFIRLRNHLRTTLLDKEELESIEQTDKTVRFNPQLSLYSETSQAKEKEPAKTLTPEEQAKLNQEKLLSNFLTKDAKKALNSNPEADEQKKQYMVKRRST
jgi:hypothetical protein